MSDMDMRNGAVGMKADMLDMLNEKKDLFARSVRSSNRKGVQNHRHVSKLYNRKSRTIRTI